MLYVLSACSNVYDHSFQNFRKTTAQYLPIAAPSEVFEREYLLSRDTAYWEQLCTPPVRAGEEPRLPDPNCANNRKLEMELILSGGWSPAGDRFGWLPHPAVSCAIEGSERLPKCHRRSTSLVLEAPLG